MRAASTVMPIYSRPRRHSSARYTRAEEEEEKNRSQRKNRGYQNSRPVSGNKMKNGKRSPRIRKDAARTAGSSQIIRSRLLPSIRPASTDSRKPAAANGIGKTSARYLEKMKRRNSFGCKSRQMPEAPAKQQTRQRRPLPRRVSGRPKPPAGAAPNYGCAPPCRHVLRPLRIEISYELLEQLLLPGRREQEREPLPYTPPPTASGSSLRPSRRRAS